MVTLILPEVPDATTAVILVAETTLKDVAAVPPKLTAVAPVKLVPVKVTVVPLPALVGFIKVMVGAGINVNPARVAVPPGVVTLTLPEVPEPTTAVMLVAETTLNEVAAVPPKLTAVAFVKLVPVMVTDVPTAPLVGLKLVMVGAGAAVTVKLVALVPVSPPTVTVMAPVVAPVGTDVVMPVLVLAVTVAVVPLNFTVLLAGVVEKFVPEIVTVAPTVPLVGAKPLMVGVDVVAIVFRKTETVAIKLFDTAKSGFPSASRSTITTLVGLVELGPVVKSTLEPNAIVPVVLLFLNTETALIPLLAAANSGLASPSRSPMVTL